MADESPDMRRWRPRAWRSRQERKAHEREEADRRTKRARAWLLQYLDEQASSSEYNERVYEGTGTPFYPPGTHRSFALLLQATKDHVRELRPADPLLERFAALDPDSPGARSHGNPGMEEARRVHEAKHWEPAARHGDAVLRMIVEDAERHWGRLGDPPG